MNREAIFHRAIPNYVYNYDGNKLHIILRTKKNDVKNVNLVCGDSSEFVDFKWIHNKVPMVLSGTGELYDYWKAEYKPQYRRLRYCFEISDNETTVYYTEKGFYNELFDHDVNYHFCFPFLQESDVFTAPKWAKDTVWYQIFPERFANGDERTNPKGVLPWGSEAPLYDNFFGGDFEGIIQHLDYLTDLGITGIYLTPIFKALTNHKYDTIDYMEIDPQFGTKETFREFIEECHKRGIRVILDAVFNHSGYYFKPFQDTITKGESSEYRDWFYIREDGSVRNSILSYDTFGFEPAMPKLNTTNEEVTEYLLNVAQYWTSEFNIDGWRLDVASEVDPVFWQKFRRVVKSINPEAYILGEVWHDALPWLNGDKFDAVMNYPYTYAMIDYFGKEIISSKEFREKVTDTLFLYPRSVNEAQFNLLDSHDTPRTLTLLDNDKEKMKLMYFFHFTFLGTPCIYYGTEIGMTGGHDPENRKCMVWEEERQDLEMFNFFKDLILLRKEKVAFGSHGSFKFLEEYCTENVVVYERKTDSQKIIFMINNANKPVHFEINELKNKRINELLIKNQLEINEVGSYTLEPNSCAALEIIE